MTGRHFETREKCQFWARRVLRLNKFWKGEGNWRVTACFKADDYTCVIFFKWASVLWPILKLPFSTKINDICGSLCGGFLVLRASKILRVCSAPLLEMSQRAFEASLEAHSERFWDLESSIPSFRIPKFGSVAWLTLADVLLQPCYKGS